MELNKTCYFVQCGSNWYGCLTLKTVRELHNFNIHLSVDQFMTNDTQMLKVIYDNFRVDPTNTKSLNMVTVSNRYKKIIPLIEAENFVFYLNSILSQYSFDVNSDQLVTFVLFDEFKISLTLRAIYRIRNFVKSFCENIFLYQSFYKYIEDLYDSVDSIKENSSVINKDTSIVTQAKQKVLEQIEEPITQVSKEDPTNLDIIFDNCASSILKSSVIHYYFTYFQYIKEDWVKITKEISKKDNREYLRYITPMYVPGNYFIDEDYFRSVVDSLVNFDYYQLNRQMYNLIDVLYNKYSSFTHTEIMMILYILFVYVCSYIKRTTSQAYENKIRSFIHDPNMNNAVLNYSLNIIQELAPFKNKINFTCKIYSDDLLSESSDNLVETISNKYKHILPISTDEFVELVLGDLDSISFNKQLLNEFNLSKKKIIDVNKIINNSVKVNRIKKSKSYFNNLFASSEENDNISDEILISDLLNYGNYGRNDSDRIISFAYKYLLMFVEEPSIVLKSQKINIPGTVIKLFDIISKKILIESNFINYKSKDAIVNTLDLYNLVLNNLQNSKLFNHVTILYIVFQLVIPYLYDRYRIHQYFDILI